MSLALIPQSKTYHVKRSVVILTLSLWTLVVVVSMVLLVVFRTRIEEKSKESIAFWWVAVIYKVISLIIGWFMVFTMNRKLLIAHIYLNLPVIIFSIVMFGSYVPLVGYSVFVGEVVHELLVYLLISELSSAYRSFKGKLAAVNSNA